METFGRLVPALCLALMACTTSGRNGNGGGMGGAPGGSSPNGGGGPLDLGLDPNTDWVSDPPPKFCGPDGGTLPPPPMPGGTAECPDDKNREGCPCPQVGMQAPCWPGARAHRGLGICKDGVTTCQIVAEISAVWGHCEGYVLPDPSATDGARACECFSHGQWQLDNVTACFIDDGGGIGSGGAISNYLQGTSYQCPTNVDLPPTQDWSTSSVRADCGGHFKLCYALKGGDPKNPKPTDCTIVRACTETDYVQVNMVQNLPALGPWLANSPSEKACALEFATSGGYGEMSVEGLTLTCDTLDKVFHRVTFCPLTCNSNPSAPQCAGCTNQGGSGSF
jgi:hypothetical protein